jgi:hypothetical protein
VDERQRRDGARDAASAIRPISSAIIVTPVQCAILSSGRREVLSPKIMAATPRTYMPISTMVTMMPARSTHCVTAKSFLSSGISSSTDISKIDISIIDDRQ